MLIQLIKYEWRGLRFPMLFMLSILGVTTLLTCCIIFTINPEYDDVVTGFSVISLLVSALLYYLGIIGCCLGAMLIIAIRFYKTCYTDQGYLTHTLPVSPNTLLAAKTISAILSYLTIIAGVCITVLIIIAAIFTHISNVSPYDADLIRYGFFESFSDFDTIFRENYGIGLGMFIVFCIIFAIVGCISAIMTVLGCVSLGQLFTKHRIIGAIIAYFGVMMVNQFIGYLGSLIMYARIWRASELSKEIPVFSLISPSMIITLIGAFAISIAMYFINLHMITKRLNLE